MPISQAVLRLLQLFEVPVTVPGPEESRARSCLPMSLRTAHVLMFNADAESFELSSPSTDGIWIYCCEEPLR